jgi:uncharacterized protein YabN with tetrapyrrole methylase and pyrophosphatase domain
MESRTTVIDQSAVAASPVDAIGASLIVVGLGIQWRAQTTLAAERAIRSADSVFFAVVDPAAALWIRTLNPRARSFSYPHDGRPRYRIYEAMVDSLLEELRLGKRVCGVFYGSPSVLARPAHLAITKARSEGLRARMLPGVSSLDCLFADLGIDPGDHGLSFHEASLFLDQRRKIDTRAHLVLCQVAMIGNPGPYDPARVDMQRRGVSRLSRYLRSAYPEDHDVAMYRASSDVHHRFRVERAPLGALGSLDVEAVSTLYVPPLTTEPCH